MTILETIASIIRAEFRKFYKVQFDLEEISNKNPGKYPDLALWWWKMEFKKGVREVKRNFLKDYYNLLIDLEIDGASSETISRKESTLIRKLKKELKEDRELVEVFFKREFFQY